jgi:hypothetical protein
MLVVRDDDGYGGENTSIKTDPLPVQVFFHMTIATGAGLRVVFDDDSWDSTISFLPGIPIELGGSLELAFARDVDVVGQVGRTFKVFDWTGVSPVGAFEVVSDYEWDTANLYSRGDVTLVPEPEGWVLGVCAVVLMAVVSARSKQRRAR